MYVSHVQFSSKAARSNEVVASTEGADLGPPIGAYWTALTWQTAAVQHLERHSSMLPGSCLLQCRWLNC